MNGIIDKKVFASAISKYDNSYQKFSNPHIPTYKEFFVESRDDAEFYGYYLATMYRVPKLNKCYGCNGKKEVLREYQKYTGKKAGFIVDLDYLPFDKRKYEKVIVTTGYSMENFFFYKEDSTYNFELVFDYYYSKEVRDDKINQFLTELNEFKEKYLLYYAFFKTCMELNGNYRLLNNHIRIKDLVENDKNVSKMIDLEIANIDIKLQVLFRKKYNDNINSLNESGFMLIRGHDIFDFLVDYLQRDGKNVKVSTILQLAYGMNMPNEFYEQINILDN